MLFGTTNRDHWRSDTFSESLTFSKKDGAKELFAFVNKPDDGAAHSKGDWSRYHMPCLRFRDVSVIKHPVSYKVSSTTLCRCRGIIIAVMSDNIKVKTLLTVRQNTTKYVGGVLNRAAVPPAVPELVLALLHGLLRARLQHLETSVWKT
ncbi:hypothetical protein EVAR_74986_1 [Eumeta japonica]|uniref:Uncharacterized protein n=1 Tax=Eumeta variegata TaxID=151549 RepID=A0A4C1VA66_EUMVA|nr:hypothetical protein EVAR_74986_1 [Eumeta japonica]